MRSHLFKSTALVAGMFALIGFSASVLAHNPMCECKDIGGGMIRCTGGFSDGSGAPGISVRLRRNRRMISPKPRVTMAR